jgi:hypothetical protein
MSLMFGGVDYAQLHSLIAPIVGNTRINSCSQKMYLARESRGLCCANESNLVTSFQDDPNSVPVVLVTGVGNQPYNVAYRAKLLRVSATCSVIVIMRNALHQTEVDAFR